MTVDLSAVAGFPLMLDVRASHMVAAGPVRLGRTARRQAELAPVLLEADGLAPTTELYWNLPLLDAGPATDLLEQTGLTYSCVLLPPLKIGREYVKTQGHYHPDMAGSDITYPEVYAHLWGEPALLMQRRRDGRSDEVDDCLLIELRDGAMVTIPPGYAHVLINPTRQPAAVAGLYSRAFSPVYDPIVKMAGAAYFLIDDGGETVLTNPRYTAAAALRRMSDTTETQFAPPESGQPLWTSFLADSDRYAFLYDPDIAQRRFGSESPE
jgi:oxalate decarboxylase/phosphoglucose isomerase-like protein (cupin superfamily)